MRAAGENGVGDQMSDVSLAYILENAYGIGKISNRSITFGNQVIDPNHLDGIVYDNSEMLRVVLPYKLTDKGEIVPDFDTYKEIEKVVEANKNSPESVINRYLQEVLPGTTYDKETKSLTAIDFKPYTNGEHKIEPLFKTFFVLDSFKKPYEKKISGKILSAALNNMKSDKEQKIKPYEYDYNKILDILEYNNPKDLVDIIKLKKCIEKIVLNKSCAKTKCQKLQVDNYIDNAINVINYKLINEFEQA